MAAELPSHPDRPAGSDGLAAARCIVGAFSRYNAEFRAITRRAPQRFDQRDWKSSQYDSVERIELYDRYVARTVDELQDRLGRAVGSRQLWREIRARFGALIEHLADREFTKTFFNSISRRVFGTVGVAPDIEFVATDLDPLAGIGSQIGVVIFENHGSLPLLFEDLLGDVRFRSGWRDLERSIAYVSSETTRHLQDIGEARAVQRVEMLRPIFYQISRAYIVGRVVGDGFFLPLVIALKNGDGGVLVDAVMLDADDVSIIFSFTRSYFHVDLERVAEAVMFLKSILPLKPVSELFTVLGRARQGKTERFRELMRHLEKTHDQFVHAAGERGLVMICFTLPSFDVVFKLIRDRFPRPKSVLREEVMAKYQLVFKHDRAGRLVDAQEFRRLRIPRARFSEAVLQELRTEATLSVHDDGDHLIFDHMYIERRMTPLNLYLRSAAPPDAERAVLDYGQCIRDLAYTNIFTGDLLLKNFGVTRHGRVIFYDYDELCRVTDCNFRELPQTNDPDDEMRAEPWFYVGDHDVFPETFLSFLAFTEPQKTALQRVHGEILTARFWRGVQERLRDGEVLEVLPYHPHRVRVAPSV